MRGFLKNSLGILLLGSAWFGCFQLQAQSDGLPRGCNEMPYVRYEAEGGVSGGGAVLRTALDYDASKTAAEASNRQYVGLSANGSFVQWAVNEPADGVTLRYTLPDNAAGTGVAGSLSVFVNGVLSTAISPGSYWAWTYFVTTDPRNAPGARPRMRFDEIHFRLATPLKPGDVLKIEKTNGDAYEYGIDFVEMESVPDALGKPAGFVSVTDYGANGTDSKSDSSAFDSAWNAAKSKKTGLYIPAGKFVLDRKWNLGDSAGVSIQGAGAWYSELFFSKLATSAGGITTGKNTTALNISHFYMNSALNQRFIVAGQVADYKAFNGPFGSGSSIHHVWLTHFETGAWLADYTSTVKATSGFDFAFNRVRYTYADGINLSQGTSATTVRQCDFRSNGDDAMAVWPSSTTSAPECHNNAFYHNTVEFTYRAGGAGIFGGYGHEIHHCLIKDGIDSAGIRFTEDFPGYHFQNNAGIRIYENTIIGCGTSQDLWNNARGAIEIYGAGIQYLFFENNDILNSPRHAIQLGGGQNLRFTNTTVSTTGLDSFNSPAGAAIYEYGGGGSAEFVVLNLSGIEHDPAIIQDNPAYVLTVTNRVPVATVADLIVPEGRTATFGVRLDSQPSGEVNVQVTRMSGDPDLSVQSGASLVFNASNWSINQTVTLAAAEDLDSTNGTAVIQCTAVGFGSAEVVASELDNDVNHPPVAGNDLAVTEKGVNAEIAVLANDTDPDSDPISIQSATNGSHGSVSHNGLMATYSPDPGFIGSDSFTYTVADGRGGTATASVAVTVRAVLEPSPYEMEVCFTGYDRTGVLANFPVLVKLGPERAGFSYGQFVSPGGDDLRFRDADRNELKYEIESWNPSGTSYVWVKVPALSKNASIWAAWGSSNLATKPGYTADGSVWSEGYAAVYHADEGGGTHKDSTVNVRSGTPLGNTTATTGMAAGADQFDGNGDAVRLPKPFGLFDGTQSLTVEFWFKADAVAPDANYVTSPILFQGRGENAWMLTFGDSAAADSLSPRLNQGGWVTPASAAGIQTGRWYFFSTTYAPSGTNNWKVFLDGVAVSQGTRTGPVTAETALSNQYGGSEESGPGFNRWFHGAMDEVRISSVTRSENWIWASWNNVCSNETFATYGAVQEVGARYAFSAAASGGGSVAGSASGDYLPGSSVSISAVAAPYYHWSHWTGNVPANQTNPLPLTMDQNRSVTAVFEPDLAANGTPAWWLAQFGWTTNFDVAELADADGDGQSALQEYLAGTDPTDSGSTLRARLAPAPSGGLVLFWSSVAGKSYRIEQATSPAGSWSVQTSNIPATPPSNAQEQQLPSGTSLFFRVRAE